MDELIDIEDYVDEFELPYDDFHSVCHGDAFLYLDKRGYLEKVKVSLYDTYWEENYIAYVHGQKRELVVSLNEGEIYQGSKVWFFEESDDRAREMFVERYQKKVRDAEKNLRESRIRLDRVKNQDFKDLKDIPIPQRGVRPNAHQRNDPFDEEYVD